METRPFPKVTPHSGFEEVFDNIFFLTGSVKMGPMPVRFSRNMTVVRDGDDLTLISTIRLDEDGLKALDALGKVKHVVRVAGFHGMDDAFYKDRYDAKVWAVAGQVYAKGFDATTPDAQPYFAADVEMTADTELPIAGAKLFLFETATVPEGIIILERDGGILVTGDSLQHWHRTAPHFSLMAKVMMRVMGFIKPFNVGPGWLKGAKPDVAEVASLLQLEFEHVLPVHGDKVIGSAKEKFRPAIERLRGN